MAKWVKGQSGNPAGGRKLTPLTDELKRQLAQRAHGGVNAPTHLHLVVSELIQRAETGDMGAQRIIWEYVQGKPVQPIDLRRSLTEEAERLAAELGIETAVALREVEAVLAEARRA